MDNVQDVTTAATEREAPIYARHMSPEDAEIFHATTATPELGDEVRLLRTMMVKLAAGITENHAALSRALTVLVRLLGLQAQQEDEESDLERDLAQAAGAVLRMKELAEPEGEESEL